MIIKRIELKNIRSHKDSVIDFPKSTVLLAGDIGSGKTSILLAIEFALFGFKRGELEGKTLLKHGCNLGKVRLIFEVDKKEYVVDREIIKKGQSYMQGTCSLYCEGKKEEIGVEELNKKITEILNLVDSKKKNMIYRFTVYTPQEQMNRIMTEKADNRLDIIRKLFNLDKYKRIKENLLIYLRECRARIKNYKEKVADLEDLKKKMASMNEEVEKIQTSIIKLKKDLGEVIESKKNKEEEINKSKERIEVLESKMIKYKEALAKMNEKNKIFSEIVGEIKRIEAGMKEKEEEKMKRKKIDLIKKSAEIEEKLEVEYKVIEKLRNQREQFIKEEYLNKKIIEETLKNIEESRNLNICPKCKQKVSEEHKRRVVNEMEEKLENYKKTIIENRKKVEELDKKIKSSEEKISNLNKEAVEIEKNIKDVEFQIEKIKDYKEKLKRFEKVNEELKELKKIVESVRVEESYYKKIKEEVREKEKELATLNEFMLSLKEKIAREEEKKKLLDGNIKDIDEEIKKKKEIEKFLIKFNKFFNWIGNDFYNIIDKLERTVLYKINKDFELLLRKWFSILVEDGTEVRLSEDFTPIIEQNGYENEYSNLSGGEKAALSLSYRLALNQLINSYTEVKTKGLLVLDEPTYGFSQNQLEKMGFIFKEIKSNQIIIVSHDPKIESFVDKVIRLEKRDSLSKVIY